MSRWAHISAVIRIDIHGKFVTELRDGVIQQEELDKYASEFASRMPKMTGSEGNASVFVNKLPGHSMSKAHWDGKQYVWSEYQTRYCLTIIGDLRDRTPQKTRREFNAALRFLKDELGEDFVWGVAKSIKEMVR